MKNNKNIMKGFSLIPVIFIMVVLALVGTFIVSIAGLMRSTPTLAIQGVRAYYAAKSALEWGTYQVVTNSACFASPTTFSYTQAGLNNFQATVTCTPVSVTEGTVSYQIYRISAQGFTNTIGNLNYVSRQLAIDVTSTAADNL
jgi:MSHA biogenesis protein MshP